MLRQIIKLTIWVMLFCANFSLSFAQPQRTTVFEGSELVQSPDRGIRAIGIKFANGAGEAAELLASYKSVFDFLSIPLPSLRFQGKENFVLRIEKEKIISTPCPTLGFNASHNASCVKIDAYQTAPDVAVTVSNPLPGTKSYLACTEIKNATSTTCLLWLAEDTYVMHVNVPPGARGDIKVVACAAYRIRRAIWPKSPSVPDRFCEGVR